MGESPPPREGDYRGACSKYQEERKWGSRKEAGKARRKGGRLFVVR